MASESPSERLRRLLLERSMGITPNDPAEELRRIRLGLPASSVNSFGASGAFDPSASVPQPTQNRILASLSGAARGLAGFLEPLQLPQDALFAAVSGAIDPNTTIADRFRRMRLGAYAPWGDTPERPASGREIFELAGFSEPVAKWAGIGADLFADPLLFGSYLRVGGRLLRSDDLLNLGDRFDYMLSPLGVSREVMAGARRASPAFSDFLDERMNGLVQAVRNPESTVFGIQGFGQRFQSAFDVVAPRQAQLELKFGKEVGSQLRQVERMAEVGGTRISTEHLNLLAEAQSGLWGERGQEFVRGYVGIVSRYQPAHERHFADVPQILRDATERSVYDVARQQGLLFSNVSEESRTPGVRDLFNEVRQAAFGGRRAEVRPPDEVQRTLLEGRARVRQVAEEVGEDADKAVERFNSYLQEVIEIDASLGRHVSGFDFVKGVAYERVIALTGNSSEAESFWNSMLSAGVHGQFSKHLQSPTRWKPADALRTTPERMRAVQQRRTAYKEQLFGEMESLGIGDNVIDSATLTARLDDLERSVSDLYEQARALRPQTRRVAEWNSYDEAVDTYVASLSKIRNAMEEIRKVEADPKLREAAGRQISAQRGRNELGQFVPGGTPQTTSHWDILHTRLAQAVAGRSEAARRVDEAMNGVVTGIRRDYGPRMNVDQQLTEALREMDRLHRDFNTQQFRFNVAPEEAARARERARAAAATTPLPAMERNLTVEEMVAERLTRGMSYDKALNDPFTVEEIIGSAQAFSHLDLGAYLQGLANGHLRRAYGLFQDRDGFERYLASARSGKIISSNVLDEANLPQIMVGFEPEAELIRQYQRAVAGKGRGTVIRQDNLIQHMIEQGVEPGRAQEAMMSLIRGLNSGNPAFQRFITALEDMVPRYHNWFDNNRRGGMRSFYSEREEIPQEMLEMLAEFARPSVSLSESAEMARRVMTRQQLFQNTWRLASAKGLVRNERFVDEFGTRYVPVNSGGLYQAFDGKFVHPQLLREMERALKADNTYNGWQRIRALLTGGFLAAPNVLAANFFGGLYQSATVGLGPERMLPRIARVWDRVRRAQDGEQDEVIELLRKYIPLEISSLAYHDFARDFQRLRLDEVGMGPEGLRKTFADLEDAYKRFLDRPGIGPLRTRYAGLHGFEMIENVFKVAAFEEMLEELPRRWARQGIEFTDDMVEATAAEFARTVVFDYAEVPRGLEMLKNTGVVLFPGFSYFLAGRTLEAYLKRPGQLALADRMSEAITNMQLEEDEKLALYLGMPEWLRNEQGVPLTMRVGEDGSRIASTIPLSQLIPTTTLWDAPLGWSNPWADSVTSLGLWGPWYEVLTAIVHGEGEAVLSARYGNRVFDEDARGAERLAQIGRFLFNTHAPGVVRRLAHPSYNEGVEGLIPSLVEFALPPGVNEALYSFEERRRGRPEREFKDEVIGALLRSPQPIAIEGPLAGIRGELQNARRELQEELASLRTKYQRAVANGNTRRAAELEQEIIRRSTEFNDLWRTYTGAYQRATQ